ncbi:MAG: class A sortase [Lactobacillaceae bacterium]|jgi:sortase A|nr:class A sortase [Lactobacillaceae bacterium]
MSKNTEQPNKKKRIKDVFFYIFVAILLLLSAAMIFHSQIEGWLLNSVKIERTQKQIQTDQLKKNTSKASYDWEAVESANWQSILNARNNTKELNVIGALTIPAIKMNIAVAPGVDNLTLLLAAGTMYPDQTMGKNNYPLASHHTVSRDALFGPLYYHAKKGQKAYLTDFNKTYVYKITKVWFVDEHRIDVAQNHWVDENDHSKGYKDELTLITCDATGAERLIVRAKLVEVKDNWQDVSKKVSDGYADAVQLKDWKAE